MTKPNLICEKFIVNSNLLNTDEAFWKSHASKLAIEAHTKYFSRHHGLFALQDHVGTTIAIAYFDNHPYAAGQAVRQEQMDRLRARLSGAGVRELAASSFPFFGKDTGYTELLVVENGPGVTRLLNQHVSKVIQEAIQQIPPRPSTADAAPEADAMLRSPGSCPPRAALLELNEAALRDLQPCEEMIVELVLALREHAIRAQKGPDKDCSGIETVTAFLALASDISRGFMGKAAFLQLAERAFSGEWRNQDHH